jgi:hypothetical protein
MASTPDATGLRSLAMPAEPPTFDCRSARQVLRLRCRDWLWPTAIAIAVAITVLGRTGGEPYRIGSVTDYMNTKEAKFVWLAAIAFAGARWCWIGRWRARSSECCRRCGYPTNGFHESDPASRCPECGADAAARWRPSPRSRVRETFGGASLARWLLDLPGLLVLLYGVVGLVLFVLIIVFRVVQID